MALPHSISINFSDPADASNWEDFSFDSAYALSSNFSEIDFQIDESGTLRVYFSEDVPPVPPVTLQIDSVSVNQIDQRGGTPFVITGIFPVDSDLEVYLGANGDITDERCYGGLGYGKLPQSSDGTTVTCYSPALVDHGSLHLTVRIVSTQETETKTDAISVLERNWNSKQFSMRSHFPSWFDVGYRQLDGEDRR